MPPVDEATFIAKADLLIAAVTLLANRLSEVRTAVDVLSAIGEENKLIALEDQRRDETIARLNRVNPRARRDGAF